MFAIASLRAPLLRALWVTCALLAVPAVAMLLTREVQWGPGDFVAAAVLLLGTGSAMVVAARVGGSRFQRAALLTLLALAFAFTWAELAVGIVT